MNIFKDFVDHYKGILSMNNTHITTLEKRKTVLNVVVLSIIFTVIAYIVSIILKTTENLSYVMYLTNTIILGSFIIYHYIIQIKKKNVLKHNYKIYPHLLVESLPFTVSLLLSNSMLLFFYYNLTSSIIDILTFLIMSIFFLIIYIVINRKVLKKGADPYFMILFNTISMYLMYLIMIFLFSSESIVLGYILSSLTIYITYMFKKSNPNSSLNYRFLLIIIFVLINLLLRNSLLDQESLFTLFERETYSYKMESVLEKRVGNNDWNSITKIGDIYQTLENKENDERTYQYFDEDFNLIYEYNDYHHLQKVNNVYIATSSEINETSRCYDITTYDENMVELEFNEHCGDDDVHYMVYDEDHFIMYGTVGRVAELTNFKTGEITFLYPDDFENGIIKDDSFVFYKANDQFITIYNSYNFPGHFEYHNGFILSEIEDDIYEVFSIEDYIQGNPQLIDKVYLEPDFYHYNNGLAVAIDNDQISRYQGDPTYYVIAEIRKEGNITESFTLTGYKAFHIEDDYIYIYDLEGYIYSLDINNPVTYLNNTEKTSKELFVGVISLFVPLLVITPINKMKEGKHDPNNRNNYRDSIDLLVKGYNPGNQL